MMTKHRHTESEIATKLAIAEEMAAQGRLHGDIAKSLGISLMTYHRWRKARGKLVLSQRARDLERTDNPIEREQMSQIRELRLENSRLRNLLTDLLLEKVKLGEYVNARDPAHRMVGRNWADASVWSGGRAGHVRGFEEERSANLAHHPMSEFEGATLAATGLPPAAASADFIIRQPLASWGRSSNAIDLPSGGKDLRAQARGFGQAHPVARKDVLVLGLPSHGWMVPTPGAEYDQTSQWLRPWYRLRLRAGEGVGNVKGGAMFEGRDTRYDLSCGTAARSVMNSFFEHHKDSIRWHDRWVTERAVKHIAKAPNENKIPITRTVTEIITLVLHLWHELTGLGKTLAAPLRHRWAFAADLHA
jgi:putative transposase